ncbi:helix-turn-helix domain-containing protein [Halorubrum rubrum]|uniref:Helix-turn-helix domain-containing protein n=1 Tax=Halorubrum rubrum TaxID=1126240 RepID=A0ABD5R573_9EURY|nr:helix-turn-helix domain-containing protein [Halorubrum rubrum]
MLSAIATRGEWNSDGGELSQDEVFDVLSNRRRRFVIHALKRSEDPIEVSELSTHVTAWELDVDPEEVEYEDRRNVYSTLQRTHLPKLEEKDIVTVDDENLVRATPALRNLDIYVEVLGSREIPWSLYYVGLAGVAAALLLAVATGTPGFAAFTPLDVGVFTATAFGVSSVVHHVVGRRARLGNTEKPPELRKVE